jgi:hypothetical protein
VTEAGPEDVTVEKFAQNGGQVVAGLGVLVVLAMLVAWASDPGADTAWVPCLGLVLALLIWTSMLRPRVLVQGSSLVLRNMLSTVRIPLAAIDEVVVRQVLAVRAGDRRYVCAGAGRSLRQAMKGSAAMRARAQMGGFTGEMASAAEGESEVRPGALYADYVEIRIRELIKEDQVRLGVTRSSPEAAELARHVRREPAWPEIAVLGASMVLLVVAILVR